MARSTGSSIRIASTWFCASWALGPPTASRPQSPRYRCGRGGGLGWSSSSAPRAGRHLGQQFPLNAPPSSTRMFAPARRSGRWPGPEIGNTLAVNRRLLDEEPRLAPAVR